MIRFLPNTWHALFIVTLFSVSSVAVESPVWFWHEDCGGPQMGLDITLDGTIIHRATFAVCQRVRSATSEKEKRVIAFSFVAPRAITWNGYLDENNVTAVGTTLDINVWQAGAESNAITLGITCNSLNQIYMNTLHIANIGSSSHSDIAPGLVSHIYPLPNKPTRRAE